MADENLSKLYTTMAQPEQLGDPVRGTYPTMQGQAAAPPEIMSEAELRVAKQAFEEEAQLRDLYTTMDEHGHPESDKWRERLKAHAAKLGKGF